MMYIFQAGVILLLNFALSISATPVTDCENGIPLPTNVQVNDCYEVPCPLKQGTEVVMNTTFRSIMYTEDLTPEVIAYALGNELNYPFLDKDACGALLNTRCPVEKNERTIYQLRMPILSLYPLIPVTFKFTLYGDNGTPMICFIVDAEVVRP